MASRPIYFDTETTGIRTDKDKIIEIAAYDAANDTSFVSFVNPGIPIPPEASAIHHITDEMVKDAPSFATVGQQFLEFCEGDVILIAHNGDRFDMPLLKNELTRNDLPTPKWKTIDSLTWARRYRPDIPRHALQFLREIYGIPENSAHRALDDVMMMVEIFSKMIDDLSIDQVYELLNQPRLLQHMPFGKHQGTPLKQLPSHYLKWLSGSGALEKPENEQLRKSFEALNLISPSVVGSSVN
ncbi:MAG: DUF3820 family protein [Waddliaceae bacterium]